MARPRQAITDLQRPDSRFSDSGTEDPKRSPLGLATREQEGKALCHRLPLKWVPQSP